MPEMPGVRFHTGFASEQETTDKSFETLTLFGEDADVLEEVASGIEDRLVRVPGVLAVKKAADEAPNELALVLDRDRAMRQQVNPRTLATMVGYALRGQALPRIYYGGQDIPVRIRFEEQDRQSLAELRDFSVPTETGETLAIGTLVDVRQQPAATRISRRDKQTARRITLELEEGRESEARLAVQAVAAQTELPEGVAWARRVRNVAAEETRNLMIAALMSIAFVYLLMGFLFESFLLPLAILITIPLASMGVTWIHVLSGRDLDFLGLVGLIILIGVVVNNGIVLLDSVNRLRANGMERGQALLEATDRRFRPIMMTALTTIGGMVPLLFGQPDPNGPELQELRVDPDRRHGRGDAAYAARGAGVLHADRGRPRPGSAARSRVFWRRGTRRPSAPPARRAPPHPVRCVQLPEYPTDWTAQASKAAQQSTKPRIPGLVRPYGHPQLL